VTARELFFIERGGAAVAVLEGEGSLRCCLPLLTEESLVQLSADLSRARRLLTSGQKAGTSLVRSVKNESWWWRLELRAPEVLS